MASLLLAALVFQGHVQVGGVAVGFYDQTCPQAESIVTQTVREFNSKDPTTPAALLRLLFHDCFVEVLRSFLTGPLLLLAFRTIILLEAPHCIFFLSG